MSYPPEFAQTVHRIFGAAGRDWLPQLPDILAQCREMWGLPKGTPCPTMSINYIEFTTMPDGQPAALKVGFPHEDVFTEMEALALYDGRGAVRLLASDHDRAALLLQRAVPGTLLWQRGDNREQTRVAAAAMKALFRPVPEQTALPHFSRWTERAFHLTRTEWDPQERWPRDLLDRAEEIMTELTQDSGDDVVLHGDLHHENILWDDDAGWLVIDPKGVIGPRYLEVGRYIQNQLPAGIDPEVRETLVRERIEIFSDELAMPVRDVVAGALVDLVLSHVWCFEESEPPDAAWYEGIELGYLLCRLLDGEQ